MIWLFVAHVLTWFFVVWFVKLLLLLVLKQAPKLPLFWTAFVFGVTSFILHYALFKVAAVPLTI